MSRFNLIDEQWIPVRFLDGARGALGIKDTLRRSKEIAAVEDPSPLVVAAVHRFLLAVLYRALDGPTDPNEAKTLFRDGIPEEKIDSYLERFRNRFWLFDEKYPFGQIPTFEPKTLRAWTVLAAEHNADNAKVLFDHVDVAAPGSISAAAAARWLLATQAFSVSCGKSELSHTGTAPSATAVMVLPLGRDLQDTLLLSLVPQNRMVAAVDLPLWEREPETVAQLKAGIERPETGLSDRYTWRTRSIRLAEDDSGRVAKLAFASGVGNASRDRTDPMHGYRIDDKNGKLPLQFRSRGFWRDFDSLLPDGSDLAPLVIEQATKLAMYQRARFPRSVMVLGQANNKAKIEFWRMERFALPAALATVNTTRSEIRCLLTLAEDTQRNLWSACSSFARDVLGRGDRQPAAKDVSAYLAQLPAIPSYWSHLESRFHEVLGDFRDARDAQEIRRDWLKSVRDALASAWELHRGAVINGDAWAIRALVRAEGPVNRKLRELNEDIAKYEPKEVQS